MRRPRKNVVIPVPKPVTAAEMVAALPALRELQELLELVVDHGEELESAVIERNGEEEMAMRGHLDDEIPELHAALLRCCLALP